MPVFQIQIWIIQSIVPLSSSSAINEVHVLHFVTVLFTFLIISTYFELYMNRCLKRDKLISVTSKWNKKKHLPNHKQHFSAVYDQVDTLDKSIIQVILCIFLG